MPNPLRNEFSPIELAMRIAIAPRLSVRGLMTRYCMSRASAYRYLRMWCDLHGLEGPSTDHRKRKRGQFWSGGDAADVVYSRAGAAERPS